MTGRAHGPTGATGTPPGAGATGPTGPAGTPLTAAEMGAPATTIPAHLPRDPAATQTVDELRHDELITIHQALARLCGVGHSWVRRKIMMELDKFFGACAVLFLGGVIGGTLGLFPFLDQHPTHVAKREYIGLLAVAGLIAFFCVLARIGIKGKEIESIDSVYERVDRILTSYEQKQDGTTP
jgi:hypothetical protein